MRWLKRAYRAYVMPRISRMFLSELIRKTGDFRNTTWLGTTIRQNVLDLWVLQEVIAELRPALLIECGTNRGGSAQFFGQLFDLLNHGHVLTIDAQKLHTLDHPRVTFVLGSSLDPSTLQVAGRMVQEAQGPVMVILDSDHSAAHVAKELAAYHRFVSPGSMLLVQDGIIDVLPFYRSIRPGPLPAIRDFVSQHPEFEVDEGRASQMLITHHPMGWLRRRA
jgi:cephalosporin hydroxylase